MRVSTNDKGTDPCRTLGGRVSSHVETRDRASLWPVDDLPLHAQARATIARGTAEGDDVPWRTEATACGRTSHFVNTAKASERTLRSHCARRPAGQAIDAAKEEQAAVGTFALLGQGNA